MNLKHTTHLTPDEIGKNYQHIWIFAYGSLMWKPQFEYLQKRIAVIEGFNRALCIASNIYRGTLQKPGLVFGLEEGQKCVGCAFEIDKQKINQILTKIRQRELVGGTYHEIIHRIIVKEKQQNQYHDDGIGEEISALVYVAKKTHPQYAGYYNINKKCQMIQQGYGKSGSALEYLEETLRYLENINVEEPKLRDIMMKCKQNSQ